MNIEPIEYNGGVIWVDTIRVAVIGEKFYYLGTVVDRDEYKAVALQTKRCHPIVAQSPSLSIPNIPCVEVEEGVTVITNAIWEDTKCNDREWYELGYKAASAKKWSDEELKSKMKKWVMNPDENLWVISLINSLLQPKIKSIEIEMVTVDNSEWNDEHTVCYRESDIEEPITYQKDGKTFLKVKSVSYE